MLSNLRHNIIMTSIIETKIDKIAIDLVTKSYDYDKKNNIMRNNQFIERLWLEEYQDLGVDYLVNNLNYVYIYYPRDNIGYTFSNSSMIHIMENFRIPDSRETQYSYSLMNYLFGSNQKKGLDKYWGFYFYIYTDNNIFYANGIKNNQDKYFTIIPILN